MSAYADELTKAMDFLAQDPRTVFIGQAVRFPGTSMTGTLANVPMDRRIETPVFEETQMGLSIGMALAGFVPVSIYPRWNFLILAANQIVNHLDKLPLISGYQPKVIIRVGIGSREPLDPGRQHDSDFSEGFKRMLSTVVVRTIRKSSQVMPTYRAALKRRGSTIIAEVSDLYK